MKCKYCNTEIKEGAIFCDNCGQAVSTLSTQKDNMDTFWNKENSKKQKEVIAQLYNLKKASERVQCSIAHGRNYKSTRTFLRTMRLLLVLCIATLVVAFYKTASVPTTHYDGLCVGSVFTAVAILIIIARAKKISDRNTEEDESEDAKKLKIKISELALLRKEEVNLKNGLLMVDKNILKNPSLQDLQKPFALDKKRITGWHIATVLFAVLAVAIFAISYYFAPSIINSILELGELV